MEIQPRVGKLYAKDTVFVVSYAEQGRRINGYIASSGKQIYWLVRGVCSTARASVKVESSRLTDLSRIIQTLCM